jgi:hypothetical protein
VSAGRMYQMHGVTLSRWFSSCCADDSGHGFRPEAEGRTILSRPCYAGDADKGDGSSSVSVSASARPPRRLFTVRHFYWLSTSTIKSFTRLYRRLSSHERWGNCRGYTRQGYAQPFPSAQRPLTILLARTNSLPPICLIHNSPQPRHPISN